MTTYQTLFRVLAGDITVNKRRKSLSSWSLYSPIFIESNCSHSCVYCLGPIHTFCWFPGNLTKPRVSWFFLSSIILACSFPVLLPSLAMGVPSSSCICLPLPVGPKDMSFKPLIAHAMMWVTADYYKTDKKSIQQIPLSDRLQVRFLFLKFIFNKGFFLILDKIYIYRKIAKIVQTVLICLLSSFPIISITLK